MCVYISFKLQYDLVLYTKVIPIFFFTCLGCKYGDRNVVWRTPEGKFNCDEYVKAYGIDKCKKRKISRHCCKSCAAYNTYGKQLVQQTRQLSNKPNRGLNVVPAIDASGMISPTNPTETQCGSSIRHQGDDNVKLIENRTVCLPIKRPRMCYDRVETTVK